VFIEPGISGCHFPRGPDEAKRHPDYNS